MGLTLLYLYDCKMVVCVVFVYLLKFYEMLNDLYLYYLLYIKLGSN